MELKSFIDFVYSMINMDEVKEGHFPLPKEMVFTLNERDHIFVHEKIKREKGDTDQSNLKQSFEVSIMDINLKFICEE